MADGMISKGKAMDWAFRILSTLIVPGAIWVGKLEVNNALQEERIRELQADVERNSSINAAVQQNTNSLIKLETTLDGMRRDISDVKNLLDRE